jgi:hypothetical protein
MPAWLNILAWIALATGFVSAIIIVIDLLARHRQHMWIMNLVWPITALYAGPIALWGYFTVGRLSTMHAMMHMKESRGEMPSHRKPFWQTVALATTHCGAGCTLGDIIAEWGIVLIPGLGTFLFHTRMFNAWALDYILAYLFGIGFQFFTIVPMRKLPVGQGLWAAIKVDTFALTAWQIGMYGWMAVASVLIFGHEIPKTSPVFWFMMQIAMLCGFLTSYPVNWWLVRSGIKEEM